MELQASQNKYIDTTLLLNMLTQNESNIDKPVIVLPFTYETVDLKPLAYSVRAVNSKGDRIEQTLLKEITDTQIRLTWTITSDFTSASGQLSIELVGVSADRQEVIIFSGGTLYVKSSLTGKYSPPATVLESALSEMHIGVDNARGQAAIATAQADKALISETNAKVSENNSLAQADISKESALQAKASEDKAKASETNSKTSETKSSQALSDLLKMIGVDIATLVGEKIPVEQIPATATQEIYIITNASELTTLVAQKGDLAELIEVVSGERTITKSWQLLTNDPTVLTNWVVWGTAYAVSAGNASTATNADNAAMINNHRMVEMAQADFDVAVKDPATYYLVH